MAVRVAIIGTAGRESGAGSSKQLDANVFRKMCEAAMRVMVDEWKLDLSKVTLVSGGSAWSDHVAVELFLHDTRCSSSKLALYLPCKFVDGQFKDEQSWHRCGKTLNQLHTHFSTKLGRSSLNDITLAAKRGATLDSSGRGFFGRNLKVGQVANYMIAFSAATGSQPSDGGTAHTWANASTPHTNRKHISLTSLLVQTPSIATNSLCGKKRKREDEKEEKATGEIVKSDL